MWGGRSDVLSFVVLIGKPIAEGAIRESRQGDVIGYFSYPNPTLKNNILDSRFYEYGSFERNFVTPSVVEGSKIARFSTSGRLEQSVTRKEYIKKILRIKELLAAGEIYQLDYAIRFRKKFEGEPFVLFLKLIDTNPSDFSAYLNCGDFQIISNSPERLFKVENGIITTQPIKGTAPKSGGQKEFKRLISSEKERAELDMITDLERNDVGKICEYGTLKLEKEREIMELQNLWHTYSEIRGKLRQDVSLEEIIHAMFPGGSITGCPKKRAMEYIELLEGMPRNIFTGSIGYISNCGSNRGSNCGTSHRSGATRATGAERHEPQERSDTSHNWKMDFSITIRTALIQNGYIEYWAGGGIVADSDPEKEYEECLLKAEKFLQILNLQF